MIVFGMVFVFVACVLIGIGIVVGIIGCALAAALLGMGIVSSSVLIGVRTKRPEAGVRAFLIQIGIITGVPAGAVCAWLGNHFIREVGDAWVVPAYGAVGGAVAGVLVAMILDAIFRTFRSWFVRRQASLVTK